MYNQRWSPDGQWIVATPITNAGLYLFNLARREWTVLTTMQADYPNWSRGSDSVLFCSQLPGGEQAIYRVSLQSRKVTLVSSLIGTPRAWNEIYSRWVGIGPDDSPLVLRSADLQRIYLLSFTSPR